VAPEKDKSKQNSEDSPEAPAKPERPKPFNEQINQKIFKFLQDLLLEHGEVRSLAVVIDWYGALNDAPIGAAVWVGEDGPVQGADAIMGSAQQTIKLLSQQFGRLHSLNQAVRGDLDVVGTQVVAKREELEEIMAEIAKLTPELEKLKPADELKDKETES
jgi:hypothetical protein